jgi:hypothetical protein
VYFPVQFVIKKYFKELKLPAKAEGFSEIIHAPFSLLPPDKMNPVSLRLMNCFLV